MNSLNLDLGFVPTPSYNAFLTQVDLFKLVRNIKLKKFFGQSAMPEISSFKKKSSFVPNVSDPNITVFEQLVLRDLSNLEKSRYNVKHNISKQDLSDLKELARDRSVILKPADKGGGIVLLDSDTCRKHTGS